MRSLALVLLLLTSAAQADEHSRALVARAWPTATLATLDELGTGIGVVFTPDLSVKGNCDFYRALGFACFESPDWLDVVSGIREHNTTHPGRRIRTLILETHGTNGHGLKLQAGKKAGDARSYIAVAALQELLEPAGVRHIIISACNSGRLLRPEIYRKLNRNPGDELFLPPTRGILDATEAFDPKRSRITVVTPGSSQIETTLVGAVRELSPEVQSALDDAARERGITLPRQFAVSEMLIQLLLRDDDLVLRTGAHVEELSKTQTSAAESERLFRAFVRHLDSVAARESPAGSAVAAR